MKKAFALLLALLMLLQGTVVFAQGDNTAEDTNDAEIVVEGTEEDKEDDLEEQELIPALEYDYDLLTVGNTTPFDGKFFTQMWGNVSSDLDVRLLIHGYNLIEWRSEEGIFNIDPSVVSGTILTQAPNGDRTFSLTLYTDLFYSDGTPITAWDYAFSMLLSIAPEVAEIGGNVRPLEYIVGYDDYISGQSQALSGIRVMNDNMIAITIDSAYLPFFYELALLDCTPYPISVIAPGCRVADDGNGIYIANLPNEDGTVDEEPHFTAELLRQTILDPETGYQSHPTVVSGPYTLASYDGESAEFEINEYYKGNSNGLKPSIQRIIYKTVANDSVVDQLATGDLMLLNKTVSAKTVDDGLELMANAEGFDFTNYTRSGMAFFSFCCEQEPVNNPEVRKAISMCLDKENLIADSVGAYGLPVDGYYGLGQWMYQLINHTLPYPVEEPEEGADTTEYEKEVAAWDELTLDEVTVYPFDVEAAIALLEQEGYTLNKEGEAFDPEKDEVRCKKLEDGTLAALELKLLMPEGSAVTEEEVKTHFIDHLAEAGIVLTVETQPMQELLLSYYREQDRDCQMIFLATNFDVVFDPALTFRPDGEGKNGYNPTAIDDEELFELAVSMRQTEPDNLLEYCQKWVAMQERFQEVVPVIPVYSSVYFDFYPRVLHNYNIGSNIGWGQAVVGAYLSDAADEEEEEDDGELIVVDE